VQLENARDIIVLTVFGRHTVVNDEQLANTSLLKRLMFEIIYTLSNDTHPLKAPFPIIIRFSGRLIDINEEQSLNA
jgi:hypothetical protein